MFPHLYRDSHYTFSTHASLQELKASNIDVHTAQYHSEFKYKESVRKDTGVYTITIKNEHGQDSADIDVVVLGKSSVVSDFRLGRHQNSPQKDDKNMLGNTG